MLRKARSRATTTASPGTNAPSSAPLRLILRRGSDIRKSGVVAQSGSAFTAAVST